MTSQIAASSKPFPACRAGERLGGTLRLGGHGGTVLRILVMRRRHLRRGVHGVGRGALIEVVQQRGGRDGHVRGRAVSHVGGVTVVHGGRIAGHRLCGLGGVTGGVFGGMGRDATLGARLGLDAAVHVGSGRIMRPGLELVRHGGLHVEGEMVRLTWMCHGGFSIENVAKLHYRWENARGHEEGLWREDDFLSPRGQAERSRRSEGGGGGTFVVGSSLGGKRPREC